MLDTGCLSVAICYLFLVACYSLQAIGREANRFRRFGIKVRVSRELKPVAWNLNP